MINGKCSPDDYKSLKISIGEKIKKSRNAKIHSWSPRTKICKDAVKKLPFAIRYVPDRYNNQEMSDRVILENDVTLMFVPDFYKNQKV